MYKYIRRYREQITSLIAIVSLLLNLSFPIITLNTVYAEEVVVEEISTGDESTSNTADKEEAATDIEESLAVEETENSSDSNEETAEKPANEKQDEFVEVEQPLEVVTETEVVDDPVVEGDESAAREAETEVQGVSEQNPQVELEEEKEPADEGVLVEDTVSTLEEVEEQTDVITQEEQDVTTDSAEKPTIEVVDEEDVSGEVCLSDDAKIETSSESDWHVDGETATTKDDVELGVRYEFPLDKDVSVTFTCLPKDEDARSHLKIERIDINDLDLPEDYETDSPYAYDITTDMEDGYFEYEITLPKPEEAEAEIVYIEKSVDEAKAEGLESADLKEVDGEKQDGNKVKAEKLDHFTIFIPTVDVDGPNDQPGQKDLTKFSYGLISGKTYEATFSWDNVAVTNPVNACILINTDGDSGVNYAVCVEYDDDGTYETLLYSCSDKTNKPENCWSAVEIGTGTGVFTSATTCTVSTTADDPFPAGDDHPNDRTATCTIEFDPAFTDPTEVTNVCSYPSGPPNSDASDCLGYTAGGFIQINKVADPDDSTIFSFSISDGDSFSDSVDITGSGTSQLLSVPAGTYSIVETLPAGWGLDSATCDDGTPTAITNGLGGIDVSSGNTVTCTFNNSQQQGTLIVKKVLNNDNGGQAVVTDFSFKINGGSDNSFEADGQNDFSVDAGTYSVVENAFTGYSTTYNNCTNVVVPAGGSATCTITNDDQAAKLIVNKTVVNNNGGSASPNDFNLTIDGNPALDEVEYEVTPGLHVVGETQLPGYVAGSWGGACDENGNVTVALGETKTCTITNDDKPATLIVKKVLVNNDGGTLSETDFTFVVNGGNPVSFEADGQNDLTVPAGSYTVVEPAVAGYSTTYSNCSGLNIPNGGTETCTITNNDAPANLTVIKHVNNDDGGTKVASDFTMTINGVTVKDGNASFSGAESPGTTKVVFPGSYNVTETGPSGYADTYSADCSGAIALGESKTCTVTNDDKPGTLRVIKKVINDNNGTAVASDFTMQVTGTNVAPSASFPGSEAGTSVTLDAGSYSVDEVAVSGYTKSLSDDCSGTIANGETKTCTITNTDDPGTLIVKKVIKNDDGGTLGFTDFSFKVNGGSDVVFEADGENSITVNAGTYTVVENSVAGYSTTYDNCSELTIPNGGRAVCTITNDDIAPQLKLVKKVTNDDGGTAVAGDWDLTARTVCFVNSSDPACGFTDKGDSTTFHPLDAGRPYVLSESGPSGYTAGAWVCDGGQQSGNRVTLGLDDEVTCTITNDDNAPTLKLVKVVRNNNGGNAVAGDWDLSARTLCPAGSADTACGFTDKGDSTTFHPLDAGRPYVLSESGPSGYTAGSWVCDGGQQAGNRVTLGIDEDVTCTITNDDVAPKLTLIKQVVNDNGGNAGPNDFGISVDGSGVLSNVAYEYDANVALVINEAGLTGYDFVSISGHDKCPDSLGGSVTLDEGDDITCTIKNDDKPARLTLVKKVTNDDGGKLGENDFGISVDGTGVTSGYVTYVSSNTPHYINENDVAGYSFVSITGYYKCPDALGGSITLDEGENAICYINNDDDAPKLKLVKKVTNDDGGKAVAGDWDLTARTLCPAGSSDSACGFTDKGDSSIFHALDAGRPYTLWEDGPKNYTAGSWACDGGQQSGNRVTLGLGDEVTCTITNNDDAPRLKLVKKVVNDDGGTAVSGDWDLTARTVCFAGSSDPACGFTDSGDADKFYSVDAGKPYILSETGPSGYTASEWACEGGTLAGNRVTLALGEDVVCTITNDDNAPKLKLVKSVTNDNGGTAVAGDWTLHARTLCRFGDTDPACGFSDNGDPTVGTFHNLDAGRSYRLYESGGPDGYTAGSWECSGGTLTGTNLVLGLDDEVTCTLTNDDQPGTLIVKKVLVNDNGGTLGYTDFSFKINGGDRQVFESDGQNEYTVPAGYYSVLENPVTGYRTSYDNCREVQVTNGGTATCTITNDDVAPRLKLVKTVQNQYGGTAVAGDWELSARRLCVANDTDPTCGFSDNGDPSVGVFHDVLAGRPYTLLESGPDGYEPGTWECRSDNDDNHVEVRDDSIQTFARVSLFRTSPITLSVGEVITCTIRNSDKEPELTVIKVVEGSEEFQPSNFEISVFDGSGSLIATDYGASSPGTTYGLSAGTYYVSEDPYQGFSTTYSGDCDEEGMVTLTVGNEEVSKKTCIVTNTAEGELYISKYNNAWPNQLKAGDEVEYKIEVRAEKGRVNNVVVTDVIPDGLKYVAGSATFSPNEPSRIALTKVYSSPGEWTIDYIDADETITLTYKAQVTSSADAGVYPDLAVAEGANLGGGVVLASSESSGFPDGTGGVIDGNTVGTKVEVTVDPETITDEISVDEEVIEEEQVLGASTYLPATGSDTAWLKAALIALLLGLVNIFAGILIMRKKIKLSKSLAKVLTLVLTMALLGSKAFAGTTTVRIEEPAAAVNSSFEITFVVLNTNGTSTDAMCYVKKPGSASFTQFGPTFTFGDGSGSDACAVTSSVLSDEGTYQFKVETNTGGVSDTVSVDYDGEGPERPKYIKVDKKSSCKYEIEVRTHGSGGTTYIEIYADDDKEIDIKSSTKIKTKTIGPDEKYEFDYEVYGSDCAKTWYFATRAFDSAGNPSDARVQEIETTKTVTKTVTDEGTTQEVGAIPVSGGGVGGDILGSQTDTEAGDGTVEGEVLGDETGTEGDDEMEFKDMGDEMEAKSFLGKVNPIVWGILLLVVIFLVSRAKKKDK